MAAKVSIIIPTYNVEKYIEQCLDSITRQTLRELEIIVSDDCSTDGTMELLQKSAAADGRIRILSHSVNSSTSQCRKDGVLVCSGEYVMFVDGDDYLEENACELAYNTARAQNVDIVQFGTAVENCANVPQSRIDDNQKRLEPYVGKLSNEPLLTACFVKRRFSLNLSNKICRAEICRRAFARVEDGYFQRGEDAYAVFFLLLESGSYFGIADRLYHYCFGRGSTGKSVIGIRQFEQLCTSAEISKRLQVFTEHLVQVEATETVGSRQADVVSAAAEALKTSFFNEQIGRWLGNLRPEDQAAGFFAMERAWAVDRVSFISMLAQSAWDRREQIAQALSRVQELRFRPRPIRTVALYYHNAAKGGAQRVVAMLSNLFAGREGDSSESRYRVILITDESPTEEDYEVLPCVIRETLPPHQQSAWENFAPRARAWERILREYEVDAVLYSEWTLPILLWDMLAVKATAQCPALLVHLHNISCWIYQNQGDTVNERAAVFPLAEGLVALSEFDRLFWSRINPRVYCIANPCFSRAHQNRQASYGKHVLWLGRVAPEKQPEEILDIMEKVAAADPEVVCHVVGNDVGGVLEHLRAETADRGLQNNVVFEGFHKDVRGFYEKAGVFLMTSRYEGFPLTLYEAASFGLPTVTYEMPWLSYFQDIDGWTAVAQKDADAAAQEILRLVNTPALWQERSDAVYQSALAHEKRDILGDWLGVFEDLERGVYPEAPRLDKTTDLFLDQIAYFHGIAIRGLQERLRDKDRIISVGKRECERLDREKQKLEKEKKKLKEEKQRLEKINRDMKNSLSFRLGRTITRLPRRLRAVLRRLAGAR